MIRIVGAALFSSLAVLGSAFSQSPCTWVAQSGKVFYDCSGNVGIDTTSPASKLTVSGGVVSVTSGIIGASNGFPYDTTSRSIQVGYDNSSTINNAIMDAGFIQAARWGTEWRPLLLNPGATGAGGNVGVGTYAPPAKFTVGSGVVAVTGGTAGDFNGFVTGQAMEVGYDALRDLGFVQAAKFGQSWSPLIFNPVAGSVGIGTGTVPPAVQFEIQGGSTVANAPTTIMRLSTKAGGSGSAIELGAWNDRGGPEPIGKIAVLLSNSGVNHQTGDMVFSTSNNGTLSAQLRLQANGTTTITGNAVATGSITATQVIGATYQDFAEWVPASTKMDPGTVVVLNPERNNEVKPSEEAYDTRVAGVVSANPGVLLGTGGDSSAKIATTGRVRIHVDANRHPIHIGDLLVTSDVGGTAMVSEPITINGRKFHQPGTIIGKALEPLGSGRGDVLVLLSLQ
jgi:hypothetical protein